MSNIASLDNSRRLYELSGWGDTTKWYTDDDYPLRDRWDVYPEMVLTREEVEDFNGFKYLVPAYDSDYLLMKLPPTFSDSSLTLYRSYYQRKGSEFVARYKTAHNAEAAANTPANALVLLAIKLFEENILTKERNNE